MHRRRPSSLNTPSLPTPLTINPRDPTAPSPPPPPQTPSPWLWRCHGCCAVYRLACTRRCIECGHTMCTSLDVAKNKVRRRGRRSSGGPCSAEFDYAGWEAWGVWRRGRRQQQGQQRSRERLFIKGRSSCVEHCDYPSECHNTRWRVRMKLRRDGAGGGHVSPCIEEAEEEEEEEDVVIFATDTTTQGSSWDEGGLDEPAVEDGSATAGLFGSYGTAEQDNDDGNEADEILATKLILAPEEADADDSSSSSDRDPDLETGLITLAHSNFPTLRGGASSPATPTYPPAADGDGDSVMHDVSFDEDDEVDIQALIKKRQRRSQLKLFQLTGAETFLPLSPSPQRRPPRSAPRADEPPAPLRPGTRRHTITTTTATTASPVGRGRRARSMQVLAVLPKIAEEECSGDDETKPSVSRSMRSSSRRGNRTEGPPVRDGDDDSADEEVEDVLEHHPERQGDAAMGPGGIVDDDFEEMQQLRSAFMRGDF